MRTKKIPVQQVKVVLDTFTLVPGTFSVLHNNKTLDTSRYFIDEINGILLLKDTVGIDTLQVTYRVFPFSLNKTYSHKSTNRMEEGEVKFKDPFKYTLVNKTEDIFNTGSLNKSGNISRGVSVGNNQDLAVNSNLSLQLSGKLSDNVNVLASVTDNNIPIQPDGNTQQLQDFDQVYIKVFTDKASLIAGDFWMKRPRSYFMNYNKRTQGASFNLLFGDEKEKEKMFNDLRVSAAISKGKFARNIIQGIEGNQGPYRLRGAENETFIIVLAGTEQVYIDGELLQRGQEKDYIIDYNTAELIFTPNRPITKDRRIIVEFQYSDKNYARSIVEVNDYFIYKKWQLGINVYSEQDAKNQPLQQILSDENKLLLASVGDSLQNAFAPGIDSTGFINNQNMYSMVSMFGYDSVFVFSVSPDSALYKLNFSFVGQGRGNYVQSGFTAFGKVFKWVPPDTVNNVIIKKGNYEPVILLVSPKQRQMVSATARYNYKDNSAVFIEAAYSNFNQNTFSDLDKNDDGGAAIKTGINHKQALGNKAFPWYLIANADVEFMQNTFTPIERFRAVEFERNWNILNQRLTDNQFISDVQIGLEKKNTARLLYGFNSFLSGNNFRGFKNNIITNINTKGWIVNGTGSYLQSSGLIKTQFLRHKYVLSKSLKYITIGYRDEHEHNMFYFPGSDSLLRNSYRFYDWEAFVQNPDTLRIQYGLFFRQRTDWLYDTTTINKAAVADQYGARFALMQTNNHQIRAQFANRVLRITDSRLTTQRPENSLLTRFEYDVKLIKSVITASVFYETGTGQELRRQFIYIEVPAGQGQYAWIDYNENGIKELNEFEIAVFPDQAKYIRSFIPGDEYIRTYNNQYSQTVNVNPARIWSNKKGIKKILALFSDQAALRVDRKTSLLDASKAYNPFLKAIADTSLLSLSSLFRNTLFFNRTGYAFSCDYTYQETGLKSLLANGFDSRNSKSHQFRLRWNIVKKIAFFLDAEKTEKSNLSDFLNNRNYFINQHNIKPKFVWQPDNIFRWSVEGEYTEKHNVPDYGGEQAYITNLGTEMRYSSVNKGSILAGFNYIQIKFTGLGNSPVAFEMLSALQNGKNYTWNVTWQQNLSKNMQININYLGRKSETAKVIHTGNIQVRAFF